MFGFGELYRYKLTSLAFLKWKVNVIKSLSKKVYYWGNKGIIVFLQKNNYQ